MASGHLVAHGDFPLLGDVDPDHHIHAGGELVARLTGKDLHIHNDAALAVGHLEGGVPDLPGLLAKDGPQQTLLGGQVGLSLGGDLAHQNVPSPDLRAHADDAPLVQVLQGVLAHVGDVPGDGLGAQLGVPGLGFVLLNVDGGKDVVLHHPLVEEDGVLVVVALPGHEAHEDILAQGNFAVAGGGAVYNDLPLDHPLSHCDDGALVDAGGVVGAQELNELVLLEPLAVIAHRHILGGNLGNDAVLLGQDGYAGVDAVLVLLSGGHHGGLGGQQGHRLPLHVGAHEGPVGVVVLQEGNHRGGDGEHHLGGYVDIVHLVPVHRDNLTAVAAGDAAVDQTAVFVHRLGGLGNDELVLHIGGHIVHLFGDAASGLIHLSIGGLNEAVPVDAGIGGQIGNQADVGTFRRLDGAQAAIVAVVNVPHVEGGPVPAQTAGAQGGHAPLMGELCQGIGLVHELAQGGGTEELLDGGGDGADVNQGLGGDDVQVLDGHALPNYPLHAGEADAELILEQLAHAAQAAVAQMVDIVGIAHPVGQTVEVIDGRHDIVHNDVLGNQVVQVVLDGLNQVLALVLGQQVLEDGVAHPLGDAVFLRVEVHKVLHVHHVVGEHLDRRPVQVQDGLVDALGVQLHGPLTGENLAGLGNDLPGGGVRHRLKQLLAVQSAPDSQLFVELVPAHGGQVIPPGVEEQAVDERLGGVHRGGLAGAELSVNLQQGLLVGLAGVLLQGGHNAGVLPEELQNLPVGLGAHRADEAGHRQLAVLVNAHIEQVGQVRLVLQPRAPVGNHRGGIGDVGGLILGAGVVDTRRADNLGDDDPLRPVDYEGARLGHQGEIPHKNLLLLDFLRLLVAQADHHLDGRGIGGVPGLAFLHVVLGGLVHGVADEGELQIPGVVGDGGHILKDLLKPLFQEPLVGVLLHLQQVGHIQDFLMAGIALAEGLAVVDVLDHHRRKNTSFSLLRAGISLVFRGLSPPMLLLVRQFRQKGAAFPSANARARGL